MRNFTLLFCFLISANFSNAQEILKTFHKEDGTEISERKSDYTRIIKKTPQEGIYSFEETWKDGSIKRNGFVSEYKPKFKQIGKEITYHKNGKVSQIQYIKNYNSIGKIQSFYENGKLKEEGKFLQPTNNFTHTRFDYPNYAAIQIADSLGNIFLDSLGNGKVNITYANGNILEGEYINGLKHGQRKEFLAKDKETYIESYENGKFLKGQRIDCSGKKTEYMGEEFPKFDGGMERFYEFINRSLQYPPDMKKQRIEGRVTVNFIIEKDGSLSEVKILRGIPGGEELEEEAMRVIRMSPKWIPGMQKGKPVRVSYSVPISFKLN